MRRWERNRDVHDLVVEKLRDSNVLMESSSSKRPGEFLDPCQEAASRSLKCLHRNGGDRGMCTDYFQCVAFSSVFVFFMILPLIFCAILSLPWCLDGTARTGKVEGGQFAPNRLLCRIWFER